MPEKIDRRSFIRNSSVLGASALGGGGVFADLLRGTAHASQANQVPGDPDGL